MLNNTLLDGILSIVMPQTESVAKSLRSSQRKKLINARTRKKYREAVSAVRKAVREGNLEEASNLLPQAYKQLDMAAKKNVIHPNKADRLKSRLSQGINQALNLSEDQVD